MFYTYLYWIKNATCYSYNKFFSIASILGFENKGFTPKTIVFSTAESNIEFALTFLLHLYMTI